MWVRVRVRVRVSPNLTLTLTLTTFLRVYKAGHMVPRDQPAVALAMLNAFLDDTLARA